MKTGYASELLYNKAFRVVRVIKDRVGILRGLDYASETPVKLATLVEQLASRVEDFLTKEKSKGDSEEVACQQAGWGFLFLAGLYSHLEYVEAAVARNTPWSLVRPFEELAESIHGGASFLLRPTWSYNYTIYECIENLRAAVDHTAVFSDDKDLKRFYSPFPQRLYVTSFARLERLNALFHILLGHEIAHPLADKWTEDEDQSKLIADIQIRLSKVLQKIDLFTYSSLPDEIYTIRTYALQELMCDQACLILFGPAVLFAFDELGRTMGLDRMSVGDCHPPWRFRLRHTADLFPRDLFVDYLDRCGLGSKIRESLLNRYKAIEELVSVKSDLTVLNQVPSTKIAYEFLEESKVKAEGFIKRRLKKAGYSLESLPTEGIAELVDRIEHGIIPNEYWQKKAVSGTETRGFWEDRQPTPAGLISILISAALHHIHYLPAVGSSAEDPASDYFERWHSADRLVLRAIECAHLQRRYAEKRG